MVFDGKMLKVRCTHKNRDGNQCGNLIALGQVACYLHRQLPGVGVRHSPDQGISPEQEASGR